MDKADAVVIGAGPAGLMAAERLAAVGAGASVIVAEAMPTPARKFLMAGKSGLNLTKAEAPGAFLDAYGTAADWLAPMLRAFGPAQVCAWAEGLGQPLFTGSSGRIFPVSMKASPLLRAWLARLDAAGVELRTRWRWRGWDDAGRLRFATPDGPVAVAADRTVLALGGASWARLGSDGAWAELLAARGVALAPFRPANMGLGMDWSAHMPPLFGTPVKGVAICAGPQRVRAEFVISRRGLEGGGIYAVASAVRDGAALHLDLIPDLPQATAAARLAARPTRESTANRLRKALRLSPARTALLRECHRSALPRDPHALARLLKALPVPHTGPRPMDEAISTAGGIARTALTDDLMLRALPGTFAAGEMLDWEAPTGGYLLTACLATGAWAGDAAARWTA